MDWGSDLQRLAQQGLGPTAIVYCLAAIGLNVHFGYTGLLNFGQAGFMAVGGYALASFVATFGLSSGSAILVGLLLRGRPGPAARRPDAAAAGRLPRDRDHRRRRDHPADDRLGRRSTTLRRPGRPQGFNRTFADMNPYSGGRSASGLCPGDAYDFWVLTVGWILVALLPRRVAADAQPVGPGAQGDPRGRGRRPQPRQERLHLQDAVAGHRRRDRRPRRHHVPCSTPRSTRRSSAPT